MKWIPNLGTTIPNMGKNVKSGLGLAGALFGRVQLRLLGIMFGQSERTFHASELIRLIDSGSGAVQRELKRLAEAGIISSTVSGNRKLYQANRHSPIFQELHGLIVKTVGLLEPIRCALRAHTPNIDVAFIYGSVAKGADTSKSDIDLMIIGKDLAYSEIYASLQTAERALLRPINPDLMTKAEWRKKLADGGPFITRLAERPKLFVFGTADELERIGQPGSSRAA